MDHTKLKESMEYKLDRIEFRLRETIPKAIFQCTLLVSYILVCSFWSFSVSFIMFLFTLLLLYLSSRKEQREAKKLFNKHYKVEVKSRK